MRELGWVVALLLLSVSLAGCTQPGPPAEVRRTLERWREEHRNRTEVGIPGSLAMSGGPLRVSGDRLVTNASAPLDLHPAPLFPADQPLIYLRNADAGTFGEGLVALEGADVNVSRGGLAGLFLEEATANGSVVLRPEHPTRGPEKPNRTFPPTWDEAERSLFFADFVNASVQSVRLLGYDRGVVIHDDNESTPLAGPVTVSADGLWWERASHLNASHATIAATGFTVGGNATSSRLSLDDGTRAAPDAAFGTRAEVVLDGRSVKVEGRFTQALEPSAPVIDAEVQALPVQTEVTVEHNATEWVKVHVREATFEGDALLGNVSVDGSARPMITVPLEAPPSEVLEFLEDIAEMAEYFEWAALLFLAAPWLALAEALSCLVGGCPENHPYPAWMDAGSLQPFYYRVNATEPPGTYDATIEIDGRNYDPVEIPVEVTVTPASDR